MPASSRPLSDDELAAYDNALESISDRTDVPLSVELLDGFSAALIVAPRLVAPGEYFPVLFGDAGLGVFENEETVGLFTESFTRRWNEIASALEAPVENLADPRAYAPLILDWDAILEGLSAEGFASQAGEDVPSYAQEWAAGFLLAVESWEDDWALPENSKDENFVDACLDPFYTLVSPEAEWTAEERELSREAHVANAIWSVYDLREFWRDRGLAPREPIRKTATPGRNDPCPCGSGKKYKKCCGAET